MEFVSPAAGLALIMEESRELTVASLQRELRQLRQREEQIIALLVSDRHDAPSSSPSSFPSALNPSAQSVSKRAKRKKKQAAIQAGEAAPGRNATPAASLPPPVVVPTSPLQEKKVEKAVPPPVRQQPEAEQDERKAVGVAAAPPVKKPSPPIIQAERKAEKKEMPPLIRQNSFVDTESWNLSLPFWLLVGLVAWLVYSNGLSGSLLSYDTAAIVKNADLRGETPLMDLFTHDTLGHPINTESEPSNKLYQPLTVLTFRLNYYLHALQPTGYHVFNVVLHVLVCFLVYMLGKVVFKGERGLAALSAAFFAVHPIHTEAVDSVVGRAEALYTVFYLLSFLAYRRAATADGTSLGFLALSFLSFLLSCLSKEMGVTVLAVNALWDLLYNCRLLGSLTGRHTETDSASRSKWSHFSFRLSVLVASFALFALFRLYFVGSLTGASLDPILNPLTTTEGLTTRWLSTLYIHFRSVWLLLVPIGLSFDYSFNCVPMVASLADPRNLWTLATYAGLSYFLAWSVWQWPHSFLTKLSTIFKSRSRCSQGDDDKPHDRELLVMAFCGWFVVPFLPYAQVFFFAENMLAERTLYLPSVGFCLLLAYFLHWGYESKLYTRRTFVCLCLAVLLFYSVSTHQRNSVWDNDATLAQSGMESCPNSAKVLFLQAIQREHAGDAKQAEELYSRAVALNPDEASRARLGKLAFVRGNYSLALDHYGVIINNQPKPYHEYAYLDVGLIYWKGGATQRGYDFLSHAVKLANMVAPQNPDYLGEPESALGCLLLENNRAEMSLDLFKQALSRQPLYCGYHNNLGIALHRLNRSAEAEELLRKAASVKRPGEGDRSCLLLRANLDLLAHSLANPALPPPTLTTSSRIIP